MNTLSEQERIALEDVFLSISSPSNKKSILSQIVSRGYFSENKKLFAGIIQKLKREIFSALQSRNKPIFPHLLQKTDKNKKYLS